jgi:hypothetical protein
MLTRRFDRRSDELGNPPEVSDFMGREVVAAPSWRMSRLSRAIIAATFLPTTLQASLPLIAGMVEIAATSTIPAIHSGPPVVSSDLPNHPGTPEGIIRAGDGRPTAGSDDNANTTSAIITIK